MSSGPISRRGFIHALTAAGALKLTGCSPELIQQLQDLIGQARPTPTPTAVPGATPTPRPGDGQLKTVFRLSGRGRRISNAAKKHNANLRFLSPEDVVRAHPGDNSRVVSVLVSQAQFDRLFGQGNRLADLRLLLPA